MNTVYIRTKREDGTPVYSLA